MIKKEGDVMNATKSVLDLTIEELEEILNTNELPEGISLEGIDQRKDFAKLFKHRMNPKHIAQTLLKERLKTRIMVESPEIKSERMQIRQAELELRKMKIEGQTQMQGNLYKRLQTIEAGVTLIISGIANINQRLDQIEAEIQLKNR